MGGAFAFEMFISRATVFRYLKKKKLKIHSSVFQTVFYENDFFETPEKTKIPEKEIENLQVSRCVFVSHVCYSKFVNIDFFLYLLQNRILVYVYKYVDKIDPQIDLSKNFLK